MGRVGRYSYQKELYDLKTAEHFNERGYRTEILTGSFADIVAWKTETKEIAIIEVKSPVEKDASVLWKTKHNVKGRDRRNILDLLRRTREYYLNPRLSRLYGFCISSQLYGYLKESRYYLKNLNLDGLPGKGRILVPYLSVPSENSDVLHHVLRVFRKQKLIRQGRVEMTTAVAVARIKY